MRPTAELRRWTGLAAAYQAGPVQNRARPDTAQPTDGDDAQSASAPRRPAWSVRDGGVTAGSSAAGVHRQVYAEHEHLLAHSPGTYTTAGSSRGDGRRKWLRLTSGEVGLRDMMLPSPPIWRGHDRGEGGEA
jgi:hypothetical protein